jgi:phosphopantetheine adenylyltransferase
MIITYSFCRPIFNLEQRINFLRKITAKYEDKIEIAQVDGLLVDFCEDNDIDFMVNHY